MAHEILNPLRLLRWALVLTVLASFAGISRAADEALPQIPAPQIPGKTFTITDYGAVGDAKTVNTDAITKAIKACTDAGGGKVVIPAGKFLTGPIELANNLELHLDKDASLLLINDIDSYPLGQNKRYINGITAKDCHDIAITGEGTIDGQGQPWWDKYKKRPKGEPQPSELFPHRPHLIVISECQRVLMQDVTLTNSPMFHFIPQRCSDVLIQRIHIQAPQHAPNTDGLDPSGYNILIRDCYIDTGDDNIAMKPDTVTKDGRPSCENITIVDCAFKHGHGVSIGGQTPGGLRNMTVRNCTFEGTDNGIRLKAARGAGGLVEHVSYDNITMKDVGYPILIYGYYPKVPPDYQSDPAQPVTSTTPIWRHIQISNVKANGTKMAGQIMGLPEMPVEDVVLKNVELSGPKGLQIGYAKDIEFDNCQVTAEKGPPLILYKAEVTGIDPATGK